MNNKENIGNIINIEKDILKAKDGYYLLKLHKSKNDFLERSEETKYVKAIEKLVRQSDEYKLYIHYLLNEIGLDRCSIMAGISSDDATLELHHGPILTLFDYCEIVLNYLINTDQVDKITTFNIAKIIINEHFENNIQCLFLSKTSHELVHTGKIFINVSQAWGNLNNFLEKYHEGLNHEQIEVINDYLIQCQKYKSTDNGLLKTAEIIKDWSVKNKNGMV